MKENNFPQLFGRISYFITLGISFSPDYHEIITPEKVHFLLTQYTQRLRKDEEEELISSKKAKELRTKVLNGKRVRRSLFKETIYQLSFHADINAALNHIRFGRKASQDSFHHLLEKVWKLANPIKSDLKTNALNCYLDRPLKGSY